MLCEEPVVFYNFKHVDEGEVTIEELSDLLAQRYAMLQDPSRLCRTFCPRDERPFDDPGGKDVRSFTAMAVFVSGTGFGILDIEARRRWWKAELELAKAQFARASPDVLKLWARRHCKELQVFYSHKLPEGDRPKEAPAAKADYVVEQYKDADMTKWDEDALIMWRMMLQRAGGEEPDEPLEKVLVRVPFEEALGLVGKRKVYLHKGFAYMGELEFARYYCYPLFVKSYGPGSSFSRKTVQQLAHMKQTMGRSEYSRISVFRKQAESYFRRDRPQAVLDRQLDAKGDPFVVKLTPLNTAPCAALMMKKLCAGEHLNHAGRGILAMYLKNFYETKEQHRAAAMDLYNASYTKRYPNYDTRERELKQVREMAEWYTARPTMNAACSGKMCKYCPWGEEDLSTAAKIAAFAKDAGVPESKELLVRSQVVAETAARPIPGRKQMACQAYRTMTVDLTLAAAGKPPYKGRVRIVRRPVDYTRAVLEVDEEQPPPPPVKPEVPLVMIHARKRAKGT